MKFNMIDTKILGDGKDIIFTNGKYYMIHTNPNGVAYSEDLINWTNIPLDENKLKCENLAYGNGIFMITGSGGTLKDTYIYVSFDGINWEPKKINSSTSFSMSSTTCRFINNTFIFTFNYRFVDTSGKQTATLVEFNTTIDGVNFNKFEKRIETTNNYYVHDISYSRGLYVAVGRDGLIMTSQNLKDWILRNREFSTDLWGISYGKGLYVATGSDGMILTSTDGISWERRESNTKSKLIKSRYGNGLYVVVGYNCVLLFSIDGIKWEEQNDTFNSGVYYGMVYSNNRYVITANRFSTTKTIPIVYFDITRDLPNYENDCLFIYDKNFKSLGIIDEYISLRWKRKYFEAGDFTLVVSASKNNIALLTSIDNLIIRDNYTETAIIETIEIDEYENEIELTVSGRFLSSIFERRIIQKKINFSGEAINGMKTLINNSTPINKNFEIEPTQMSSPKIDFQCTYKNLYSYLVKLSKFSLIGFRLIPNIENKIYIFENYKGKDRTSNQIDNERYAFSDDQNNIEKSSLIVSAKTEYNFALVGGCGEDNNRILKSVSKGSFSDFDLREIFVDAKSQSNKDISQEAYLSLLSVMGNEAMTGKTLTFTSTVDSSNYKTKWDLGDIVDLKRTDWNIIEQKIISEIEEIISDGKREIVVTLGTPISQILEEEK